MKGGSSPRHDKLLDKDEMKVDLDSYNHHGKLIDIILFVLTVICLNLDLSDDSYGTVVNMSMDQDGSSPHGGVGRSHSFLRGSGSPTYLPGHTPPQGLEQYPYSDQLSVYTSLSK